MTTSKFRLSSTVAVNFTPALHAQLLRYAESINATKSKAIKRLLSAHCEAPRDLIKPKTIPANIPEPKRTVALTWHFSDTQSRTQLEDIAKRNKLTTSALIRRIVYTCTKSHASTDPNEILEATADAWL